MRKLMFFAYLWIYHIHIYQGILNYRQNKKSLSFHEFIIKLQRFWFQRHSNECPISYMIYKILNKIYKNIFTLFISSFVLYRKHWNLNLHYHFLCFYKQKHFFYIHMQICQTYILIFHMDTKTFVFYKAYIFFEKKSIYNYIQNKNRKFSIRILCIK